MSKSLLRSVAGLRLGSAASPLHPATGVRAYASAAPFFVPTPTEYNVTAAPRLFRRRAPETLDSSSSHPATADSSSSSSSTIPEPAPIPDSPSTTSLLADAVRAAYPAPTVTARPLTESVRSLLPVLAAQPAHYITVQIWGRSYLVSQGDRVRLPFLMPKVVPGDVLRLNRATVLGSRDYTLKGAPFIDETLFECRATVLGVDTEPLRLKIKKKQRCRRKRTIKSKHQYTLLSISDLKIVQPEEAASPVETAA